MFPLPYTRLRHRFLLIYGAIVLAAASVTAFVWPTQRWGIAGMLVIGFAAAWLVAWWCTRQIRQRLHELRETADAIGQGDLAGRMEALPNDEFVKFARSLDRVAAQLEKTTREHDRLRQRLTQSEKLVLIGEIAATVAHEINNPLDGLRNSTRIIRRNLDNTEQAYRLLDLMDAGLYRIEMIVRQLLTMSRHEPTNPVPTRMDEIINDAVRFVRPKLDRCGIELLIDLAETPLFAQADSMQMVQVLINLMINAIDAMTSAAHDRHKLTLRCRSTEGGRRIQLDVIDTGAGIADADRPRIFEPFYSTKAKGAGTGLGLAVVKRIVEAHHGTINVDSQPAGGTRFHIELPAPSYDPAPDKTSPTCNLTPGLEMRSQSPS